MEAISSNILNSESGINQFFLQTGGLYLFSEPVPDDGEIVSIESFGYLSDENLAPGFQFVPFIFAVVFRQDVGNGLYQLMHGPQFLAHGFAPGTLPMEGEVLDWPVTRGDMIGAIVPSCCTNITIPSNETLEFCPAQINLRTAPMDCLSALYYPFNTGVDFDFEDLQTIEEAQFMKVQVSLNMEVLISPNGMFL